MICPNCGTENAEGLKECQGCGIIFAKYKPRTKRVAKIQPPEEPYGQFVFFSALKQGMFSTPSGFITLRIILIAGLFLMGLRLAVIHVSDPQSETAFLPNAMHASNLVFHEAGHLLFSFLGQFITVLGGTLMQLTVPIAFTVYFIFRRRDSFAAAASFWWFGENFIDIAPYAYDANDLNLILLGGHTGKDGPHDWEYMLSQLGIITHSHSIGWFIWGFGCVIMISACIWGCFLVLMQVRAVRTGNRNR